MKRIGISVLATLAVAAAAGGVTRLRPPLWRDADNQPIAKPARQEVAELFALMHNSWLRHVSVEESMRAARDPGALNVNSWDGVPDSSWFTNRIGRYPMSLEKLTAALGGEAPAPGIWTVERNESEGYTPKLQVKDSAGRVYLIKFDLSDCPERNSAAERVSTLILAAAGYNVPANFVVRFRPDDLRLSPKATFVDQCARKRPMTAADLAETVARLKLDESGLCRALASQFVTGLPLGKFKYNGMRQDDANDIIPHELRRELRGLRVIASWINHADAGDKNTLDVFLSGDGKTGHVRHYLLDFGSTLGSGNYMNGPYRVGHEYVFDGAATGKTFFSLGAWRRPWEERGRVAFPEIGYYTAELFSPAEWRPNYPNLAFVRMDAGDAYWGARIVINFSPELIDDIAAEARFSRPEVTRYLSRTLRQRQHMIGRHWLTAITPLEDFQMAGDRLVFRDVAIDFGYAEPSPGRYRFQLLDAWGKPASGYRSCEGQGCAVGSVFGASAPPDAYGRVLAGTARIETRMGGDRWARAVEVALGYHNDRSKLQVLGWNHGAR